MTGGIEYGFMSFTTDMGRVAEEETARKRREVEEAERKRREAEHVDGDRDDHEHADGDRDDPEGLAMKGTTTSTWTSTTTTTTTTTTTPHDEPSSETMRAHAKGGQQESASATYERAPEGRRPTRTRAFLRDDGRG